MFNATFWLEKRGITQFKVEKYKLSKHQVLIVIIFVEENSAGIWHSLVSVMLSLFCIFAPELAFVFKPSVPCHRRCHSNGMTIAQLQPDYHVWPPQRLHQHSIVYRYFMFPHSLLVSDGKRVVAGNQPKISWICIQYICCSLCPLWWYHDSIGVVISIGVVFGLLFK